MGMAKRVATMRLAGTPIPAEVLRFFAPSVRVGRRARPARDVLAEITGHGSGIAAVLATRLGLEDDPRPALVGRRNGALRPKG